MSGAIFGLSGDRAVKAVLRGQESVSQSVRQSSVRPSVRPLVSQSVNLWCGTHQKTLETSREDRN